MSELKFPIGLRNGERVHINQIEVSGLNCNCICPHPICRGKLIARIGKIRKRHFAHYNSESNCSGGGESEIHKWAAELIEREKYLYVPSEIDKIKRVDFNNVDINNLKVKAIDKYFECDAKCIDKNKDEILIEFYYTHPCESEKIDFYKKSQKTSVEVDISKIDQIELSETNNYILINAPRKWIFPPRITYKPEGNDKSIFEEFIWPLLKIGGKEIFLQSEKLYIQYFKKPKKKKWWQF